jgi:5-methylcytosine-specific restriction endonuclease McrA
VNHQLRTTEGPCPKCGVPRVASVKASHTICDVCRKSAHAKKARLYRARHPERYLATNKQWHVKHPEYQRERSKRRYVADPKYKACVRASAAAWSQSHPEESRKITREWMRAHPEVSRVACAKRRAHLHGVRSDFTKEQARELFDEYARLCVYCLALATSLDHVVPISKGGPHTKENLVPACAHCNTSKNNRPLLVFMARRAV